LTSQSTTQLLKSDSAGRPGLRIVQLISRFQLRGAEIFASQLSEILRTQGADVLLISLYPGEASLPFAGNIIKLNCDPSARFVEWKGWRRLSKIIHEFDPDIVQLNAGDCLKFAVFSRMLFRWQARIIFRNANKVSDFLDSPLKRQFNRLLVSKVDHVISVSELCREDFARTYHFPSPRTTTIPIGIEISQPGGDFPADLRPLATNRKIIAQVASLVPEKNHGGMLQIVERLAARYPNVFCAMVGDGKLRNSIEGQIHQRNLGQFVRVTGYRTDALEIISHADVLAVPSHIEGLPGVILEAMALGTPVVAYNVGGISEVVKKGETGWLVPAGDEEAFVQAIIQVFKGESTERIVSQAREVVLRDYGNREIARRFLLVYNAVKATKREA
jgi:glycosyltransferase involved in cell wall biosynthesis